MTARKDAPSAAARIRVMKRDRFRCTYCGVPGTDAELEIDHITPVSKGGSHHIANLTTACRACNQKKGAGQLSVTSAAPRESSNVGFIGMFLHTLDAKGEIRWQGCVKHVEAGVAFVELFSWLTGAPTNIEPIPTADLADRAKCILYSTCERMNDAYENYDRSRRRLDRSEA